MNSENSHALPTVQDRMMDFERALDNIITRVETTSNSVQQFLERGMHQRDRAMALFERIVAALQPVRSATRPVLTMGRNAGIAVTRRARENPKTFALGVALIAGAVWWLARTPQAAGPDEGHMIDVTGA